MQCDRNYANRKYGSLMMRKEEEDVNEKNVPVELVDNESESPIPKSCASFLKQYNCQKKNISRN